MANAQKSSFTLVSASQLSSLPVAQLLGNTHLVAGGFNVIFGPSGAFKSFYMLGLALEVAQTGAVVYIAAEGSGGLAARVEAWCQYRKSQPGHLLFICEEVNLLNAESVEKLAVTLRRITIPIELVIFDTYARCLLGGDENSAKDAGIAINRCASIQREFKTAICLVHHANRAETGERGSGALRGGADSMIEVGATDDRIRIECSKMKDWEPWPTEFLRFMPHGPSGLLLAADMVPGGIALTPKQVKVLEFLLLEVFEGPGATSRQIVYGVGIPESSVYRVLSELKRNSHVHQDKRGDPYSITPLGEAVLRAQLSSTTHLPKPKQEPEIDGELSELSDAIN